VTPLTTYDPAGRRRPLGPPPRRAWALRLALAVFVTVVIVTAFA
jgi:hypothetical protein